jgi:hypothetical protein
MNLAPDHLRTIFNRDGKGLPHEELEHTSGLFVEIDIIWCWDNKIALCVEDAGNKEGDIDLCL